MTTELEKQFFQCFEIEESLQKLQFITNDRVMQMKTVHGYPEITDTQYLELICISNKELIRRFNLRGSDLESIKKNILSQCIKNYTFYSNTLCETYNRLGKNFKHQVQAIFKGEN